MNEKQNITTEYVEWHKSINKYYIVVSCAVARTSYTCWYTVTRSSVRTGVNAVETKALYYIDLNSFLVSPRVCVSAWIINIINLLTEQWNSVGQNNIITTAVYTFYSTFSLWCNNTIR